MKVLKVSTFAIILIAILQASSCKPDPKPQKYLGTYPLGDIKDYLYFKPGSMWVYKCDSTGELDTQVMVSCDTFWEVHSYIKIQRMHFLLKSLNEGSRYDNYFDGFVAYNSSYQYFWPILRFKTNPKYSGSSYDCIFYKPFDTVHIGGGSSPTYYKGLIPKMTVLGKDYDSVRVFQVKTGGSFPYCKIKTWNVARLTFYWSKNIGLINLYVETLMDGFNTPFNFNWQLQEYKISK
jgi:hypothetical protein